MLVGRKTELNTLNQMILIYIWNCFIPTIINNNNNITGYFLLFSFFIFFFHVTGLYGLCGY